MEEMEEMEDRNIINDKKKERRFFGEVFRWFGEVRPKVTFWRSLTPKLFFRTASIVWRSPS